MAGDPGSRGGGALLRVPELAAALMATSEVRLYHDHVLVKQGGTQQRTPWHQDQPYYNVEGRGVSAWIPVDPVPAAGCLELLAGSQHGEWYLPRTFLEREAKWFPEKPLTRSGHRGRPGRLRHPAVRPSGGRRRLFRFPDRARGSPAFPTPGAGGSSRSALSAGTVRASLLADVPFVRRPGPGAGCWLRDEQFPVPCGLAAGPAPSYRRRTRRHPRVLSELVWPFAVPPVTVTRR